jgi:hypothetical protein
MLVNMSDWLSSGKLGALVSRIALWWPRLAALSWSQTYYYYISPPFPSYGSGALDIFR